MTSILRGPQEGVVKILREDVEKLKDSNSYNLQKWANTKLKTDHQYLSFIITIPLVFCLLMSSVSTQKLYE